VIVLRRVKLLALPVTAVVERHDAAASLSEGLDPARTDPIDAMVGGEGVNEQDRLAKVVAVGRYVDERDVDPVRGKMLNFGGTPDVLLLHWVLLLGRIELGEGYRLAGVARSAGSGRDGACNQPAAPSRTGPKARNVAKGK
jgi:hypothetical protein